MPKEPIINYPDQWIITRQGDFVRIKESLKFEESKLVTIRQKLSSSRRFKGKTSEQISKERYDKVWEEVNFDPEKLHAWLYNENNKDKLEIVKLEGQDFSEAVEAIFNYVKSSKQKWRSWEARKPGESHIEQKGLINEETGQIIYSNPLIKEKLGILCWEGWFNGDRPFSIIDPPTHIGQTWEKGKWVNYNSVIIFLHGTYGSKGIFPEIEKKLPHTKIIYPHSPTLQYDMWHGSRPAPGGQCRGWINITGDAHALMDTDVCPDNPPPKKNFEEADKIIHLDYPQLRRAVNHVNDIIEQEIVAGIPPEKIFVAGYSQGGLLTLAVALTSPHKIGGFISLCGLLPRWDKLLVRPSEKNKETPTLLINNTGDSWVPFWTGKKSYEYLKERGFNVKFKSSPGLGHTWKNQDVMEFLEQKQTPASPTNESRKLLITLAIIGGVFTLFLVVIWIIKRKRK
ncbi:MAG: alpha/beta fold hydrolase [Candidatus Moeniiplasma glomeromycotorum]|nr:alpha/beta fold hydrolase [Candidatus Moeniiplasma glomeromycotorum]MCE8167383.1 alpha/beta fold hydrolase [Candidatus Moeniiplasma glomeromycotorum]MCE8168604.1 alpha/beta fold hydrolase [Candidatus Moeniiplasma glomeromycotorum]